MLIYSEQTYKDIFTSPSSSDASLSASAPSEGTQDDNPILPKKPRLNDHQAHKKATKHCVALILGMDGKVTPRSIAYAAVMVCFETSLKPILSNYMFLSLLLI